ncbi:sugar phosphate isomerase/epimerase [Oscillospiraceae bacterium OttesenSCG-928-F05]|nr:sugar phosphate isomerase/epimerase [Oscillospiraceae bacterium OttesenSCG-928-F05]
MGTMVAGGKPKRGVSLYCYADEYGVTMNLENMLEDMNDMGAKGLEILANGHIEGYPNPTDAWVENWHRLMKAYDIIPVDYGHWIDSRLYKNRELTTEESYAMLLQDIKLANRLGFTVMRTKLGVVDETLTPVANWREIIEMALPDAEKYNVVMCPEIHFPTNLKSQMIKDYVEFIDRTKTKHFGLNIDFGVFDKHLKPVGNLKEAEPNEPEDIIPLLPYIYVCHAKFTDMTDDFLEPHIDYPKILGIMMEHGWNGYLLSEYEGDNRDVPGYTSQVLRKQHVMMKRILGE